MADYSARRGLVPKATPYALVIVGAVAFDKASRLIWEKATPLLAYIWDCADAFLQFIGFSQHAAGLVSPYATYLLLIVFYLLGGTAIGSYFRSRWWIFTGVFVVSLALAPYALEFREIPAAAHMYGWKMMFVGTLLQLAMAVPSTMIAAWLASRPRKRRRERRRAAGLCEACAYNLISITSGICPECGVAIEIADQSTAA